MEYARIRCYSRDNETDEVEIDENDENDEIYMKIRK
jgi:hypothetical protein